MGLSRTVSEIDGDFRRKSQNNFQPLVFCAPTEGVPLRIGYWRTGSNNYNHGAIGPRKKFYDIFSRLDTNTKVTDRRTSGHSKDRAYA